MGFWQIDNIPSDISDLTGYLPISRVSGIIRQRKSVKPQAIPLYAELTELPAFRQLITIPDDGVLEFAWQVDCEHAASIDAGGGIGYQYPIGIAGYICWRRALIGSVPSGAFTFVSPSVGSNNIAEREYQHYMTIGSLHSDMQVNGGYVYEISLMMTGHTGAGAAAGVNGVARTTPNGGDNFVKLTYLPGFPAIS